MSRALSESLAWVRRQAVSYLVIVLILLAGGWLFGEWRRVQALAQQEEAAQGELQQRRAAAEEAAAQLALADRTLAVQLAALRTAHAAAQAQLRAKEEEQERHRARHWPWAGLHGPAALAQSHLLEEQVAALRLAERAARERLDSASALQQSAAGLARLQQRAQTLRLRARQLREEAARLAAAHPVSRRLRWSPVATDLAHLRAEAAQLEREAVRAETLLGAASRTPELSQWLQQRAAHDAAQAALREAEAAQAAAARALQQDRFLQLRRQAGAFVADKSSLFLLALLILAGALASRLLLKLALYYGVAPLASRRPALRLLGPFEPRGFARAAGAAPAGRISAESLSLELRADEELLVRPEYLQSSGEASSKRTAWLLNAALPLTSVLSGMYLLTRVRTREDEVLALSPSHDAFDEICAIELPDGAALVCQARCLAGVVQPLGRPVRIDRHWRLGSLHAWLTMQLRFLVFHGPCRLVVKGRRGIRMEPAGNGRLINQAATLGFDASVLYSTVRTETFVPYWLGKEALFNDRFGGIDGSYFYEERPLDRRGNALVGRGLNGLAEGVLKVFGI